VAWWPSVEEQTDAIHDSGSGQSEVVILDARDIAAGPIARVQIPQRVPVGFHANWFARG
jgi:carotenoid cleavage dioxygenase